LRQLQGHGERSVNGPEGTLVSYVTFRNNLHYLPASSPAILVDLEQGRSALALGGLLMDLQDLQGQRVDVVTPAALHPKIREKVLRQAVDL
jgi:predicted nucleotidyltransferase